MEPLGYETIISVKTGENIILIKEKPEEQYGGGEGVLLKLNEKKIHLFDGESLKEIEN